MNPGAPVLPDKDLKAGLESVASVQYLLGQVGSAVLSSLVFMSATSSFSGELISSSSLIFYDAYEKYTRLRDVVSNCC